MSKTIAITGATGFAGGHAVAALLKRGYRLRALVRNAATANLPPQIECVPGDLDDVEGLDRLLRGADAVVHLAGAVAALRRHDYFRVNAHGTVALAEAATRAGTGRFVHVSSLAAREPSLSPYGASKRAGEDAISSLSEKLNAVILRPPAVYGPGDRGTLPLIKELTRPIATIPGPAEARFSLIHVTDLARIIVDAVESDIKGIHEPSDNAVNGYGWRDLIRIAEEVRGRPIRALFLPRFIPLAAAFGAEGLSRLTGKPGMVSRGKIAELYHLDWVSGACGFTLSGPISFARGFRETLAWYVAAGWLPRGTRIDRTGDNDKDVTS